MSLRAAVLMIHYMKTNGTFAPAIAYKKFSLFLRSKHIAWKSVHTIGRKQHAIAAALQQKPSGFLLPAVRGRTEPPRSCSGGGKERFMGKITFDEHSKWKKFLSGKGFYVALAACLVAVCGVAVGSFVNSRAGLERDSSTVSSPASNTPSASRDQPVDHPMSNVPDDRTTTTTVNTTRTTTTTKAVTPTGADEPLFVLPLTNQVLREYSAGKQVYSQTMQDWRTHNGVDFQGEKGQKVKALADGTVQSIETDPLWGPVLTLDHGFGILSRYCGVTADKDLAKGDTVEVGDVIGTLGDIPCEILDGSHLHLEILVNDQYTDPVEAIGREVKVVATTTTKAATKTGSGITGSTGTTGSSAAGTTKSTASTATKK